jgi:hypothetical protein
MMNDPVFQTHDYIIGGKMVVGRTTMTDHYRMMLEDGDAEARKNIKRELIMQMAEYMLENQLVEFTYQDNPIDMTRSIAVRAYLAPNDQVKILRLANKVL